MRWIGLAWIGLVGVVVIVVLASETNFFGIRSSEVQAPPEARAEQGHDDGPAVGPEEGITLGAPKSACRPGGPIWTPELFCRISLLDEEWLELELTNSHPSKPVKISWTYSPGCNLSLHFTDKDGKTVFTYPYWELKSVDLKDNKLTIEPGETYSTKRSFWHVRENAQGAGLKPNVYQVQGVFYHDEGATKSEPIKVVLK